MNTEIIGGEKPIYVPAEPVVAEFNPPAPTAPTAPTGPQLAEKPTLLVVRFETKGTVFEQGFVNETLTYEAVMKAVEKLVHVADLKPEPMSAIEWAAYDEPRSEPDQEDDEDQPMFDAALEWDDFSQPYFAEQKRPRKNADVLVGDFVIVTEGCEYNKDLRIGLLGEVTDKEEMCDETRVTVKFWGWKGGHDGGHGTDSNEFFYFWFPDDLNEECTEGSIETLAI
jgi:hypothetical protein